MKKLTLLFLTFATVLITANSSVAQIVNMESQRYRTDTTGWAGSVGGNFALTNYGQKIFDVDANAHVQYKSKRSLYLFLGGYGFLKGDQQSYVDYGFLHLRYNYKLTKVLRLEAFTQLQQNTITKVQFRYLVGAGPRFKLVVTPKASGIPGLGTFWLAVAFAIIVSLFIICFFWFVRNKNAVVFKY